ncbi:MAG: hypothetical protein ACLVFL_02685 [Eubacterium sp.]
MKKFAYSRINKLCSMFLALGVLSHFHGVSFFFFGEPKYPSKDNYTHI